MLRSLLEKTQRLISVLSNLYYPKPDFINWQNNDPILKLGDEY